MAPRLFAAVAAALLLLASTALADALRVAVISDLNGSYGSITYNSRVARAVSAIVALKPDLVISTGDMVAGQRRPHLSEAEVRAMWRAFHAAVSDPLAAAGIPLAVTPGNHDASDYAGFESERRIYGEEWRARRPHFALVEGGDFPFFYAFDMGGIRFVSLDATRVGRLDAAQMAALPSSFEGAGPTRIVFSHLPMRPFSEGRETEVIADPALSDLMIELGVDLHLSGHHHAFYPGAAEGIALVSQACLGSGPRRLLGADRTSAPGFTLLDIGEDGKISVTAYEGGNFTETVMINELPERLGTGNSAIRRLDLSGLAGVVAAPQE